MKQINKTSASSKTPYLDGEPADLYAVVEAVQALRNQVHDLEHELSRIDGQCHGCCEDSKCCDHCAEVS